MSDSNSASDSPSEFESLAVRWDRVAFQAQGSPFEDLSLSSLAKSTDTRAWKRPGGKVKGDIVARYIYLSFEELLEVEKLDLKSATHLLEICESTFIFEQECDDLGSFEEINNQAYAQRMRFVEEFGLYEDFPVCLANLDDDLREFCIAEEVITFIDLMAFLDRLADLAWIGGGYKQLQNVFAHGDEKELTKYFPYRLGNRGFHLHEAFSFCLNRIKRDELKDVFEYYERRRERSRLIIGRRRMELPAVIGAQLLPEIFECMHYFVKRDPSLLIRLYDSAYHGRELMHLSDPQTEGVLLWLIHLAVGVFRSTNPNDIDEELKRLHMPTDTPVHEALREMLCEAAGGS